MTKSNHVASKAFSSKPAQYTALTLLILAFLGSIAIFISGVILEATNESALPIDDRVRESWWDIVQTLMLVVTSVGPVYIASVIERRRRMAQGDFANRVLVSLNCVDVDDEGNVEFYMRTLSETSFAEVFADDVIQEIVMYSRDHNLDGDFYPLMRVGKDYNEWKRLRDHIKNKLSSIYVPGFLIQDVGSNSIEQEYTWALTYEHSKPRDDLNDKFRILLIRTDLLDRMHNVDYTTGKVTPKDRLYDPNQEQYYRDRWATLQKMQKVRPDAISNRLMMANIKFTVPGQSVGKGWEQWERKEEVFKRPKTV